MIRFAVIVAMVLSPAVAAGQVPTVTPTPGNLVSISLQPDATKNRTISVGEFANFTATGHYDNAVTRNLTQKVDYVSSAPTIAEARNEAGNKGKVYGIAPGEVSIVATDPTSGISSGDLGGVNGKLIVQGALVAITLGPLEKNAAVGDFVTYTAKGELSDGNTKNMTQKVVYSSSDTSVAVCPNADGNKSRVEAVGVGTAIISAVDPLTDLETGGEGSGTLTVRVPGATATGRTPTPTPRTTPTLCGDPNGSGTVTVSDGVIVLSAAAGLPTDCTPAICDVNGSGAVSVTDGIVVLRVAAELGDPLNCP